MIRLSYPPYTIYNELEVHGRHQPLLQTSPTIVTHHCDHTVQNTLVRYNICATRRQLTLQLYARFDNLIKIFCYLLFNSISLIILFRILHRLDWWTLLRPWQPGPQLHIPKGSLRKNSPSSKLYWKYLKRCPKIMKNCVVNNFIQFSINYSGCCSTRTRQLLQTDWFAIILSKI